MAEQCVRDTLDQVGNVQREMQVTSRISRVLSLEVLFPDSIRIPEISHMRWFHDAPSHVIKSARSPLASASTVASINVLARSSAFAFPRVAKQPMICVHFPVKGTNMTTIPRSQGMRGQYRQIPQYDQMSHSGTQIELIDQEPSMPAKSAHVLCLLLQLSQDYSAETETTLVKFQVLFHRALARQ